MQNKYFSGIVQSLSGDWPKEDHALKDKFIQAETELHRHMAELQFHRALESVWAALIMLTAISCRPRRLRCSRTLRSERGSGKFFIICSKPFVSCLVCSGRSCRTPQKNCNVSLGLKKATALMALLGVSVSRPDIRSTVQPFFFLASNCLAKHSWLSVMLQNGLGLIDSHAHIQGKEYAGETAAVIQRAGEAGVEQL